MAAQQKQTVLRRLLKPFATKGTDRAGNASEAQRIQLPSPENDARLRALHNRHQGRRAFVLGNGPSLSVEDIERIQNEITFASNKIYLIYKKTDWRPTYLTVCDFLVARNIRKQLLEQSGSQRIFAGGVSEHFRSGDDVIFSNWPSAAGDAAWDPLKGCRAGHSVVVFGIKLAWWMGIREIYLLGIDFSFKVPEKRTGEKVFGNDVIVSEGEVNHFDPDYRPSGEDWTVPQLDAQREDFRQARAFVEDRGGKLINASRETKLDVLERQSLDDILATDPASATR
ncbi:MAG: hypothetical protein ACFBZ8_12145 [Opitutales bacterium]